MKKQIVLSLLIFLSKSASTSAMNNGTCLPSESPKIAPTKFPIVRKTITCITDSGEQYSAPSTFLSSKKDFENRGPYDPEIMEWHCTKVVLVK